MRLAMVIFSAICVGLGVMPGPLYSLLPYKVDYVPYTASHVVSNCSCCCSPVWRFS